MARVSIKDIAREVGVSTAAVSLVLNGKNENGRIGKEMSEKIRRKAKEMHYEPNHLARSLRIGRSNTIGLIIADISNLFFANLAFHIQEQAEKQGYSVIITNTNESDLKMGKMINVLNSKQVDGLIIIPTEHGDKYITDLLKRRMPVVLIDRFFPHLRVSSVTVDNYNAARKATEKMIRQGCRNIGMLVYQTELQHMQDRKRGYIDVMKENQMFNPALIKEIGYSFLADDVPIAIEHLLMKEVRMDGIFFATNTLSMLGIRQLMSMGLRIPEDMKVICFDKSDAFDFTEASIPYIQQPIPEMGKVAVDLLIEQIKQQQECCQFIELQTRMMNMAEKSILF
ncbi:MAG: LacI family transcriptional regulator [Tannerella sp.]|jgi:LacI family transcriptional regulator|nr:LacI family transcriptional regulator [Tannerella sp.]